MLSKHSLIDLGKQRDLFVETKSPPLTLLAPLRLSWGAVLNFQQVPVPAHMLAAITEWTRITEEVSAFASPGIQQRWFKKQNNNNKKNLTRAANCRERGHLLTRVVGYPTNTSQLRPARVSCVLLPPVGTEWFKKTAVPPCTQHLKHRNSLKGAEPEDL